MGAVSDQAKLKKGVVVAGADEIANDVDHPLYVSSNGGATSAKQDTTNAKLDTLHTDLTAATPAGENHIGEVGGNVKKATVNIGGAQTYATGKVMGGVKELPDMARVDNGTGTLTSALIGMKLNNAVPIEIWIFSKQPVGSYTDNATFTLDPADLPYVSKIYSVGQWFAGGVSASVGQASAEPRFFVCEDATNKKSLWVVAVARGSITLTGAADAVLSIRASRN